MTNTIPGFTDYPFTRESWGERGVDAPGEKAPIRAITLLTWDRNKCVDVQVEGLEGTFDIKFGYCYSEPGRCGEVPTIPFEVLETLPCELPEPPKP